MTKFKVGDVVRLKSGGPDMTIKNAGPIEVGGSFVGTRHVKGALRDDLVICEWFDKTKRESGRFQVDVLEAVR